MDIKTYIEDDETILLTVHRHWMSIAPLMIAWVAVMFVALYGFYALGRSGGIFNGQNIMVIGFAGLSAIFVLVFVFAYITYWIYRRNILVLTDRNLFQINQNSLVSRSVSEFSLERLQDVGAAQNGILASSFGYGTVIVETAGERENFSFDWAPNPHELASKIMEAHKQAYHHPQSPTELS